MSAGRYSGALNYQMSDEWVLQTQNAPPLESEYVATAELELETPTSSSATSFEQELLDAYISHQSLLNSVSLSDQFIEQSALISVSDDAITTTITSSSPSIISDVWKARLLLLFSAALYGTNFTMVKSLDEHMSIGLASTLRFGFAALVMLPFLFAPICDELKLLASEEGRKEPTKLSTGLAGMEIGLYCAIGYIAQAVGLQTTTASKSAFICSMAAATVPILDYIFGKPLMRRQIIGACLALAGVYALELGGEQTTITDGDIMSLVQPLMFGLGFWRMEAAMKKYPTEAARLTSAQLLMVFFVSCAYLVYSTPIGIEDACNSLPTASEVTQLLKDPYILGMLFYTGIITTAFTIWMETLALKTLSAAETTVIFSTEPLFGAAFASVVAGECLGNEAWLGAAFIICGCLVSGLDLGRFFNVAEADNSN